MKAAARRSGGGGFARWAMGGSIGAVILLVCGLAISFSDPGTAAAQDVQASVRRTRELMRELERMRGLQFREEVGVEVQTPEEFGTYLQSEIDGQLPAEQAARMTRALVALGVIPDGYDLREGYLDTMQSQAAAYYDPKRDTFFILAADLPEQLMDMTIIHELEHAMQDQYFDLGRMDTLSQAGNDDRVQAYRFLVEGEANYIGQLYMVQAMTGMNLEQNPMAEMIFRSQAFMSRGQFIAAQRQQVQMMQMMGSDMPESMLRAMEATEQIPWFILRQLMDPYNKGALAVLQVKRERGWEGVADLFRNPPPSTELLMHTEKLLSDNPDLPTNVALPDMATALPNFSVLYEDTLGEAGLDTLMEAILDTSEPEAAPQNPLGMMMQARELTAWNRASEGWDGDRFRIFESPDGRRQVVTMFLTFDTESDAGEFVTCYRDVLNAKHPGCRAVEQTGTRIRLEGQGRTHVIERHGADVVVVENALPAEWSRVRDALLQSVKTPYTEEAAAPQGSQPREF